MSLNHLPKRTFIHMKMGSTKTATIMTTTADGRERKKAPNVHDEATAAAKQKKMSSLNDYLLFGIPHSEVVVSITTVLLT